MYLSCFARSQQIFVRIRVVEGRLKKRTGVHGRFKTEKTTKEFNHQVPHPYQTEKLKHGLNVLSVPQGLAGSVGVNAVLSLAMTNSCCSRGGNEGSCSLDQPGIATGSRSNGVMVEPKAGSSKSAQA